MPGGDRTSDLARFYQGLFPENTTPASAPEPGSLDYFGSLVQGVSGIAIKPKAGAASNTNSTTKPTSNASSNTTSNTTSNTASNTTTPTAAKKSPYYTPGLKRWDEVMKEKFGAPKTMRAGGIVEGRGAGKAVKGRGRGRIV